MTYELYPHVKHNMELMSTDELVSIYHTHNQSEWTETAFRAIEEVLIERCGRIPELSEFERLTVEESKSNPVFKLHMERLKIFGLIALAISIPWVPYTYRFFNDSIGAYILLILAFSILQGVVIGCVLVKVFDGAGIDVQSSEKRRIINLWGLVSLVVTAIVLIVSKPISDIDPRGLFDFLLVPLRNTLPYFLCAYFFAGYSIGGWLMYGIIKNSVKPIAWTNHLLWGLLFGLENFCVSFLFFLISKWIFDLDINMGANWQIISILKHISLSIIVSVILVVTLGRKYLMKYTPIIIDEQVG